jgi:cellulose biosynthesis protein BcsQ
MAKIISLFNHKGGVSKTTTTFHLGWMLAELGKKVILVDSDPQCNLSGLILGYKGEDEFDNYYSEDTANNFKAGLRPAFEAIPERIHPVTCIEVEDRPNLFVLPGHIGITEYEVALGIAQELSGSIQTLQNLPGSINYLVNATAEKYEADIVLFDMNPSLSAFNQNILMISDYFIVPNSPDYFSVMALESLKRILPRWKNWADRASINPILQAATYPFPAKSPKYLGNIIQNYRVRSGGPTIGFRKWINRINVLTRTSFAPELRKVGLTLSDKRYDLVKLRRASYCLELIPNFNTLIAKSQSFRTPVFALTEEQLESVGIVLEQDTQKRDEFYALFHDLAKKILTLINES